MTDLTLALCGDVMIGRGIDQILPHPGDPALREPDVLSARRYVELAEARNGHVRTPAAFTYVWGDALPHLLGADLRIVNLETSITTNADFDPKGINYRMNPANVACLTRAHIDCCVLANNHIADFGRAGLLETIDVLDRHRLAHAGAGRNRAEASRAALIASANGRVLVFGCGSVSSGIAPEWEAGPFTPGIDLVDETSQASIESIAKRVFAVKRNGDVVVASLHWGPNFGYEIAPEQIRFAHLLVDHAGVDVVHGHSSHHPKALEVYEGKLILYGCGDFVNDYEGVPGYETYRGDLVLLYLARIRASDATLAGLRMLPFRIKRFAQHRASRDDAAWLCDMLNRESARFGTRCALDADAHVVIEPSCA